MTNRLRLAILTFAATLSILVALNVLLPQTTSQSPVVSQAQGAPLSRSGVDICANLPGWQDAAPMGFIVDSSGNCQVVGN